MGRIKRMQDKINTLCESYSKRNIELGVLERKVIAMGERQDELVNEVHALRFLIKHPSGWEVIKNAWCKHFNKICISSVDEAKLQVVTYYFFTIPGEFDKYYCEEMGKYLEIWHTDGMGSSNLEKVLTVQGNEIVPVDLDLYKGYLRSVDRKKAA